MSKDELKKYTTGCGVDEEMVGVLTTAIEESENERVARDTVKKLLEAQADFYQKTADVVSEE